MGATARRERIRAEMADAILEVARKVVLEHGYEALTIRGIAKELDYSPAAIYDYYSSKESIVEALYFEGADGLGQAMANTLASLPEDANAIDKLFWLGVAYRDQAKRNPDLYRMTFGSIKRPHDQLTKEEMDRGGFAVLMHVIHEGIANGDMVGDNPLAIAFSAWSIVHGFVSLEVTSHCTPIMVMNPDMDEEEFEETVTGLFQRTLSNFMFGIATEHGRGTTTLPFS